MDVLKEAQNAHGIELTPMPFSSKQDRWEEMKLFEYAFGSRDAQTRHL